MYRAFPSRLWVFLIWVILISVSLSVRPLFPVDETRYASVAWEMWFRNDFLVPHLNGEPYSHKPPLLFWLMHLSWKLFGVNNWSLRIISPIFSLATLYLSGKVALLLWPNRQQLKELSPLMLLGSLSWIVYSTLTMFDMMLAFFVLLGIYSLLELTHSEATSKHWLLFSLAIGGGVLAKGPVILLHLLPVALMVPWWRPAAQLNFRRSHWYCGLVSSVMLGALIALSWAIPAGISGGEAYRNAIFLGQTSGRLVNSFAHQSPWWWYLQIMPLLLLPWLLLKPLWAGFKKLTLYDPGIRFCTVWALPVFVAFSLVSGKRIHYLLPLIPAVTLILARAADEITDRGSWERAHLLSVAIFGILGLILFVLPWLNQHYHWLPELSLLSPFWGGILCTGALMLGLIKTDNAQESVFYTCIASVAGLLIISSGFFSLKAQNYDTRDTARQISVLMSENKEVAYFTGKYHGQYHFTGRLKQPISVLSDFQSLHRWAKNHPDAYIIVEYRDSDTFPKAIFSCRFPYKGHSIGLLPAATLLKNSGLANDLKAS